MKKILSLFATGIIALGAGSVSAETNEVPVPGLLYNAEVKEIENIKNVNGRVMLPFRAVFEMMGAEVDYEEATSRVTAVRGGKTVEFFVGGSSIRVTDENGTRDIAADIGFDYERDRVMVPVRFISNALGARVGWNDDEKFVYVLDTYTMAQDMKESCPALVKYFDSVKLLEKNIKSDTSLKFFFETNLEGNEVSVSLDGASEAASYDGVGTGNLNVDFLQKNLSTVTGYNIQSAEDISFDMIKTDEAVYFKTNLISKLSQILPDVTKIQTAQKFISDEDWLKLDYNYVEKEMGKAVADMLFKESFVSSDEFFEIFEGATSMYQTEEDVTMSEMYSTVTYFDALQAMFENAVYEAVGENSFNFKVDIDTNSWIEDLKAMINREDFESEEEYNEVLDQITSGLVYKVFLDIEVKNGIAVKENVIVNMSVRDDENSYMSFGVEATGKSEKLTKKPEVAVPEKALSIAAIMNLLV